MACSAASSKNLPKSLLLTRFERLWHGTLLRSITCLKSPSYRLYPPASLIGRRVSEECSLDGHVLPVGSEIYINIMTIHRNPEVWPEPDRFDPERFSKDRSAGRHPYAFIPFSAGPRNCVGQRFALREQLVVLAKFFRRFRVVAHERLEDLRLNGSMIFQIDQTLDLTIALRDS